ncbi:hypothetical protein N8901_00155 [Gammaproteobacteria bacterium]|nr:hypothetical protein [Gammaproteobacteria bacterium]
MSDKYEFNNMVLRNIDTYCRVVKKSRDISLNKFKKYDYKNAGKSWTNSDILSFHKLSKKMSFDELCIHFERSPSSIYHMLLRKYIDEYKTLSPSKEKELSEKRLNSFSVDTSTLTQKEYEIFIISKNISGDKSRTLRGTSEYLKDNGIINISGERVRQILLKINRKLNFKK